MLSRQHLDLSASIPHCHSGATQNPVPTAHAAARKRRTLLQGGTRRLGEDRRSVLWRPGRPDRSHASRACGRAQMDRRGAFPARAQFLHAVAGSRSHAARDLCRLAATWHLGRPRCWVAVRPSRRPCRALAQHRLCAVRSRASCRGGVCRHQGSRSRHRHRGPAQSCKARAPRAGSLAHRRCGLRRHLLLRCAVSLGDRRRSSAGLCACRHESRSRCRSLKAKPLPCP